MKKLLLVLLICVCMSTITFGQQTNVTISGGATTGGAWSGTTVGPYTFTPSGVTTTANIINTDIQNRLLGLSGFAAGNVTIVTTNGAGTGTGDVTFSTTVTAATTSTTQRTFTVTAGGSITVGAASAINLTPASSTATRPATIVNFTAGTAVSIGSAITTIGGVNTSGTSGIGGNINLTATAGSISITQPLTLSGGGGNTNNAANAGNIILIAGTDISITADITANGGVSTSNDGGKGGNLSLTALNGGITITSNVTLNGGNAGAGGGDVAGDGGGFSFNNHAVSTTTGGANDGQTATSVFASLGGTGNTNGNGGTFTKNSPGIFAMAGTNTYTGGTLIVGGVLSIGADANLGGAAGSITFQGGATLKTTSSFTTTARAISLGVGGGTFNLGPSLTLSGAISGGGGFTTSGSDLILNRAAGNNAIGTININGNRLFVFSGLNNINGSAINVANGATLDFGLTGAIAPANTITLASGACLANRGTGTMTVTTANVSFPSSGSVIFNNDDLATTAITVTGNYPALTGNLDIQVGGNNATVGTTTLSGIISGGFGINKTSTGTLTLAGVNAYTGTTTVTAGTLKAGVATSSFGNGSAVTMANTANAILDITGFNTTIGSLTGGGASGGNITLGAAILTIGSNNTSPAAYDGIISGTGNLIKSGTGTLILSGLNTYTGTTTINGGIININTLKDVSGGSSSLGAPTSVANGTIAIAASGTLQYTGAGSTSNRAFTLTGTGATIDASGSSALNLNGGGIGGATFGLVLTGNSVGLLSGVIATTSGTLTKNGIGTWSLFGSNTYTGKTTISNGALNITSIQDVSGGASSLGAPTTIANGTIDLSGTATLRYSGAGNTTNRVINLTGDGATIDDASNGTIILNGNITGTGNDLVLTGTGAGSFRIVGVIGTGAASVTKNGTVVLELNGANTFTGGFTLNAGLLRINNASSLGTAASTFTLNSGDLANISGGTITTNNHPIILNSDVTILAGNNLNLGTGNVTVTGNRILNMASGITLTLGGVINAPTFSLTKTGAGTFSFGANPVTLFGLTISNGTVVSTSNNLSLAGDLFNNGAFTHNNGTVIFNGTGAQSSSGLVATTYNNLTVNSAALFLGQDATVNGVLNFITGLFSTSSTNILSLGSAASATGANSSNYVVGPMQKLGNTTFEFPVGKSGLYRPIEISALSSAGNVTAEYFPANPKTTFGTAVAGGLNQVSACEYWTLTEPGGINAIVKLNFGSSCNAIPYVTNAAALRVAHWSGAQWDNLGNDGTATLTSVKSTVASTFSPFTIGTINGDLNPLPVKISSIKAYEKANGVQIDWTAYSEDKLLNYVIERSTNGVDFIPLGSVAARNQPGDQHYGFFDASPVQGVNFYRLKNVDIDAKYAYSNIVKVNLDKSDHSITLYPNPVINGVVSFQSSDLSRGNYTVRILNAAGQQVYVQKFTHTGGAINQTVQLPVGTRSGMYTMQVNSEEAKIMSKTFIVQ